MESLGLIEVSSVTGALDALDVMCKTANVSFVTWERKLGGRLVTIIVKGSVSAVTEAVDAAMERGLVRPCAHAVIANPHEETVRIVEISASRMKRKRL
ncbi:MAG: BMC domain-containing protein [Clostridia bacterium]|nr:BMC domain-containing protein [Clostridia bacterium]